MDEDLPNTHGGRRVGSGRKTKEWHAEQAALKAQEARTSQAQVQAAVSQPVQPVPTTSQLQPPQPPVRIAPFLQPRQNTRGIPLQDPSHQSSHPNHGLQVPSDQPNTSSSNNIPVHHAFAPHGSDHLSETALRNLIDQLHFLDINGPNAGVASGEDLIEDELPGLSAMEEQLNGEADAATAAEETGNAEPGPTSVLRTYLQNVKSRISDEIRTYGQPLCYKNGQLWDFPKHALFALRDALVDPEGFKPDALYYLDVFIWLPHLLCPDIIFKCECGYRLGLNGLNDNPIARRVRRRPTDYFLFTN
ncbi:hypothetical protein DFH08DRAFT_55184 [Mycena albidolilacea]|uniref:Uncharacterized protein n=1 Tax=Mycena albidolilacea TaxID=1033008 RepID=A0AAD6Z1X3_9AGAR|nr:hypothetical protein DFH08DRAFT_55184 [Mycena albidolilacea]